MKTFRFEGSVYIQMKDGETQDEIEDRLLDALDKAGFTCAGYRASVEEHYDINDSCLFDGGHCVVKGCLVKYNERWFDGHSVAKGAFEGCEGKRVPIFETFYERGKTIGEAVLREHDDGIYYKATLNEGEESRKAVRLIIEEDYRFGLYADKIKYDSENGAMIREGSILGIAPAQRVDNASFVQSVNDKPLDEWRKENK